jgi:hypothetical protein
VGGAGAAAGGASSSSATSELDAAEIESIKNITAISIGAALGVAIADWTGLMAYIASVNKDGAMEAMKVLTCISDRIKRIFFPDGIHTLNHNERVVEAIKAAIAERTGAALEGKPVHGVVKGLMREIVLPLLPLVGIGYILTNNAGAIEKPTFCVAWISARSADFIVALTEGPTAPRRAKVKGRFVEPKCSAEKPAHPY